MNFTTQVEKHLKHRQTLEQLIRYFCISLVLAALEVLIFYAMETGLGIHYIISLLVSISFIIILNWLCSRHFVFPTSSISKKKEFSMILFASTIGIFIQLIVTSVSVEIFFLLPVIGKVIALGCTFVWNFTFRKLLVFK